MTGVPSLDYHRIVAALQRAGWVVVRQKGSHPLPRLPASFCLPVYNRNRYLYPMVEPSGDEATEPQGIVGAVVPPGEPAPQVPAPPGVGVAIGFEADPVPPLLLEREYGRYEMEVAHAGGQDSGRRVH